MARDRKHFREGEEGRGDRVPKVLEHWSPSIFFALFAFLLTGAGVATYFSLWGLLALGPLLVLFVWGVGDMLQTRHAVLRNFPLLGRLRYLLESVRPELRQYFVESDQEETPFSREKRSVVYQRAKNALDTIPFGTRQNTYADGYEWIAHSLNPTHLGPESARTVVGEGRCSQPYSASLFNISAMSYGSLSKNAILAMNTGAARGGFYHNSGEGGLSPYHLEPGGDLVWQIGTGYFGCRADDGTFDPSRFADKASRGQVRMIEVKLSQGAKPAHGGILPGKKVTLEIAAIRHVPVGETVVSPPAHSAFSGPIGLLKFITQLRELSGGKPVGFKLCIGQLDEFLSILKAMRETGLSPDFITVDGAEGGTGAAPVEFTDSVGMPSADGLNFVHNALIGAGLRDQVKIISAGKIATGFHLLKHLALGADLCNSARGMMFAVGCIQALKCNTNTCPVGVATQDPKLVRGLVVPDKATRVANFHEKTIEAVLELCGAAGLSNPCDLQPKHIFRRCTPAEVRSLDEIYPQLDQNAFLEHRALGNWQVAWDRARTDRFGD